jgi:iron complex outermembrane receptor protein
MMTGSASTFDVRPERTTQLDTGLLFNRGPLTGSVSAFYALHQDYILIEQLPDVSAAASNARNIRAISYGTEAEATYQLSPHWNTQSSFAWVRGENDSDNTALGQIAPPQATFSLNYVETTWSAGALLRVVGDQNRVAPGTGNIVGQDIGRSPGFAVFSVNSGWQAGDNLRINAGIDNLFDRAYAEHISRSGADISGYETTTRVFEPGRTWWLQLQASL